MSEMTEKLMKQLRFISQASNAFMSQKKQSLTGQQRVLAVLRLEDGLNQSYLNEILALSPSSLAELLKKLENSGDVIRKEDEKDKRIKQVFLTEAGRKKAESYASLQEEDSSEQFFAGLGEEEQAAFSEFLEKIPTGWAEDFQQRAQDFVDPFDRLKVMQHFRDEYAERFGGDWSDISPEEMKQMKREMKEMAHRMHFGDFRGFPGGFPDGRRRGGHRPGGTRGGFRPGPGFPWDRPKKPHDREDKPEDRDEWLDF